MKAAETKSTSSQPQHTATLGTVQEQAFFSPSMTEATPFFSATSVPGIQAKLGGQHSLFFQPGLQRQVAFESEESSSLQAKPDAAALATASPQPDLEAAPEESLEETASLSLQTQTTGAGTPVDGADASPPETGTPFFQPKLTMGKVGDRYEREADAMADRVVSQPRKQPIAAHLASPELQQTIQRLESLLQRAESRSKTPAPPANLESRLQQSKGGGTSLDSNTRADMEGAFNADFSGVKVHTGQDSAAMNQTLGARAFTHGNSIFFNSGEYQPQTQSGRHLLAHELTHTLQQGASVQRKPDVSSTANNVQMMLPDFIIEEANEYARNIPGYTLFTVIVGYNPLTGNNVERNAINLLEGLMGLVPFGTFIFDKLREYGILQTAFEWVNAKLDRLDLSLSRLERIIEEAGDEIGYDIFSADDVLEKHFLRLYHDVETFARSLVDHIIELIKQAAIDFAEPLLADNQAWSLIKKILHYDPLRGEEVNATTAEILEDFLLLIGKQQELEKMKAEGTLQRTADWLDTQMATFNALLGELQSLFTSAIDAIRPENLLDLATNLETLSTRVDGFLQQVWDFATTVAITVLEFIKDVVVGVLRSYASNETPGYPLLTVILGKDPFTQEAVPRTPINLIRGFMSLMPGGIEQFNQMQETGVIPRAAERIENMMADLGITWPFIRDLFLNIWNSLTIEDLLNPIDTFIRILTQFREPLNRLFTFVIEVIKVILELILELMNFPSDLLASIIDNAMQALDDIQRDPVGFLINMLEAVKLGFNNFFGNILQHLGAGLQTWFFAQLEKGGIQPPAEVNAESILDLVLQILGVSMDQIWSKLGDRIGQENVDRIRGAIDRLVGIWNFIRDVQERGVGAIWEYIQSQISNLWNMVLEQAQEWIMSRVIERVTARLLSMLDPTGIMAVINGFISFFNAVQSAIEYFREILEIVNDWVTTVASVARGDIEPGAEKMEQGLASSIPVAIGFLAKQVGLDNLGEKIAEMIAAIRELVDQALDWLLDRAVSAGQQVLQTLGLSTPGTGSEPPATGPEHDRQVQVGLTAIDEKESQLSQNGKITHEAAQQIATEVKRDHPVFRSITVVDGGTTWNYNYVASPPATKTGEPKADATVLPPGVPNLQPNDLVRIHTGRGWAVGDFQRYYSVSNTQLIEVKVGSNKYSKPISTFNQNPGWTTYASGATSINYGSLDTHGRPTGIQATLGLPLQQGSSASYTPVGFVGGAVGHARGHLLGNQLGGSGSEPRNIVTLFQNPVNTPIMSGYEGRVRQAVENGEIVTYTVTPNYSGSQPIPNAVTLQATGNGGFSLSVSILNRQ